MGDGFEDVAPLSALPDGELLTYAFAADVLETIEQVEVREELEAATLRRYTERG